jgi:hypothetical protein
VVDVNYEHMDLFGGPFDLVETYVYYQGPRTFALRSRELPDLYYFVNTVDEDEEDGTLIMLAVGVNGERFRAVRGGIVPFRDVFVEAGWNRLARITWTRDRAANTMRVSVQPERGNELPEMWLPSPKAVFDLPTDTVERFEASDLVELSSAQRRTVFAIEVESAGHHTAQFPARQAGELQVAFHRGIEALARRHSANSRVLQDMQPALIDLKAASFVLVFAIDSRDRMLEPTDITYKVFDDLNAMFAAAAESDKTELIERLQNSGSRVRNRFVDILNPLTEVGSGITLWTARALARSLQSTAVSAQQVRESAQAIANVKPKEDEILVRRGVLLGLNTRTNRFDITDLASGEKYAGYMTEDAADAANGLKVGDQSFVSASITVLTQFTGDEQDRVQYRLESISPFET